MSARPWWEEFPGRLENELEHLEAAGVRHVMDEGARAAGVVQLRVTAIAGQPTDLTVTFPDLYPFVRPSVGLTGADAATMTHHVHPFSGDLCLLGRSTALWRTGDTLAWLLTTQLPKTLTAGQAIASSAEEIAALSGVEQVQAEPWTDYYTCFAPGSMILVDSTWTLPAAATQGRLQLRLHRLDPAGVDNPPGIGFLHGAAFTIADEHGLPVGRLSGQNPDRFPLPYTGRWARLNAPVHADTPAAFLEAAKKVVPDLFDGGWQPAPRSALGWDVQIVGLTFPEERVHRGTGDGWVFLVRLRQGGARPQPPRTGGRNRRPQAPTGKITTHLVRAGYAGRADMADRVPELAGLRARHVAVFGVGALGGTVVEHLARAGLGQLTVVDRDHLEPGNLVRHAAHLDMVGWSKAAVGSQIALRVAPAIGVTAAEYSLGAPRAERSPDERNEIVIWNDVIDQVDLVVDCTAEKGLQQALAWLARRRGKPYLAASATNGGWGGRIVRLRPVPEAACWACLEYGLDDGSIPDPPAAPEQASVQPAGCADPTFTGTGFDLAEVALHATRVAVATLQAGQSSGYPDSGHDLQMLTLRTHDGVPVPPAWTGLELPVHPSCGGEH
ncbi:ThiF family adenylyltransferase [Blastococcus goldschmidtiae]|uniref:ThiF family adenylyltransferase n=1 Tax=Blastococcus goldschmidtiae TaxID=3075546 RepID=A0ABU2K5T8_9ACTN|nr:ThiF family adenylyltransferase [Blastococcus sp. DSM 46792]MDT0275540.1 ThiF family adenylyltransferase [Blastococcus sp. DSM 46792]